MLIYVFMHFNFSTGRVEVINASPLISSRISHSNSSERRSFTVYNWKVLELQLKKVHKYILCLGVLVYFNPALFQSTSLETKMLKLTLVMATILLHVVASQPVDVNVEVTVNGLKNPIGLDQPGKLSERAGMLKSSFAPLAQQSSPKDGWHGSKNAEKQAPAKQPGKLSERVGMLSWDTKKLIHPLGPAKLPKKFANPFAKTSSI